MNDRDMPRDEHLRAALRHAPDAGLRPPELLKARILSAARQASDESSRRRGLGRWWPSQAWRLGGAGTLAAALLAGTVIWVGRESPPPAPTIHGEADLTRAPATSPWSRAPQPPPGDSAPVAVPLPAGPAADSRDSSDESRNAAGLAGPRPGSPIAAASPPIRRDAAARERAAEEARPSGEARSPAAGAARLPSQPAPIAPPALAAWAADEQTRWLWRIDGASPAPLPAGWLAALASATAGRWQTPPAGEVDARSTRRVDLQRDGRALGTLQLQEDRVLWCEAGACLASPVEAGAMRGLLEALR